jgi:hypothetical protein
VVQNGFRIGHSLLHQNKLAARCIRRNYQIRAGGNQIVPMPPALHIDFQAVFVQIGDASVGMHAPHHGKLGQPQLARQIPNSAGVIRREVMVVLRQFTGDLCICVVWFIEPQMKRTLLRICIFDC